MRVRMGGGIGLGLFAGFGVVIGRREDAVSCEDGLPTAAGLLLFIFHFIDELFGGACDHFASQFVRADFEVVERFFVFDDAGEEKEDFEERQRADGDDQGGGGGYGD